LFDRFTPVCFRLCVYERSAIALSVIYLETTASIPNLFQIEFAFIFTDKCMIPGLGGPIANCLSTKSMHGALSYFYNRSDTGAAGGHCFPPILMARCQNDTWNAVSGGSRTAHGFLNVRPRFQHAHLLALIGTAIEWDKWHTGKSNPPHPRDVL